MSTIVYLPMCLDYIHIGHINILSCAVITRADRIVIGLVSDKIMDTYKERFHTYEQRRQLAYSLKGVTLVWEENQYPLFIRYIQLKEPAFVIHGDDWCDPRAFLYDTRNRIKKIVESYGGQLIEPKYTLGVNSTCIRSRNQHSKV